MKPSRPALLAMAACFACAGAIAAPYAMLDAFRETVSSINATTGLRYTSVALLVQSTNPAVAPTDIVMTIHGKKGPRMLRVGPGGVLTVPEDADLARENPDVSLNQPKGTVNIRLQPFVRAPIGQARTLDVVALMSAEYEKVRRSAPLLARTYRIPAKYLRIIPEQGGTIAASTSCGVEFSPARIGVQTPLASFPKGCVLSVSGQADRIEFVFAR